MDSWEENAQTWKTLPFSSSVIFFAGVFCIFASLVLVGASMSSQSQSLLDLIGSIVVSGACAIAWAYAGTRKIIWAFFVILPLQVAAFNVLARLSEHHSLEADAQALHQKLQLNGYIALGLIIAGYILFITFFSREGARFFRTQTEVRLAGEIHRALVPPRHTTFGKTELFGSSVPSGEVGGDLFDILQSNGNWHAYVADVSGHGVPAGILMSMIKSAATMQLTMLRQPGDLLTDLNTVLQPYTSPANYFTFAYVGSGDGDLKFALAGHLPILHYRAQAKAIVEHSDANVPIGLFKNQTYAFSELSLSPGDLLAVITDGFTEVFDSKEREIGLEQFKSMLRECAEKPLPTIYRELRSRIMKYGRQTDDQTMLLIRRLP
jgi:hypothetical protein